MKQPAEIRHVMIFENRDASEMRVATALRRATATMPLRLTTAADLPAIRQALQGTTADALVIEVGREAGDALAALRALAVGAPFVPLYVYNGFLLPRIGEKTREYPQVRYFEDQANLEACIAAILDELGQKRRGIIHGIALASFLGMMNQEKFSGRINVSSGGKQGTLFLSSGRLISAQMGGSRHNTALSEMSGWDKVSVEIREESQAPAAGRGVRLQQRDSLAWAGPSGTGCGRIDILRFTQQNRHLIVHVKQLQKAMAEVKAMLADHVLRMDVFLASDGRSLVGWNSHSLACSAFAAVTRSVSQALAGSGFPALRNYYLLELADGHTVVVLTRSALQWGLLLKGARSQMGLLLHVVIPKALRALAASAREAQNP